MRKLFSILAVALFALSAHATVVTKDFDLSQSSNYGTATVSGGSITGAAEWSGLEAWAWTEGISAYDQIVIALEDHTQTVLFKVIYSDESSMQVELPTETNMAVINLDPAQNIVKGIQVLNWSENSDIDITITDLFFRGAIGIKKNVTIWSGTKTFDEFDWENRLLMAADNFADLHVGDILEVYYTLDDHDFHQFDIKTNYDNKYPSFAPKQINLGGSDESGVLRFYIADATDLSNIASQGGLYLNGKYITFTKVSVIKHEVLWTGEQIIGNWSGNIEIPASKLSDLQIGNIICVRVTAFGATENPRVSLYNGWSNSDALVGGEYYFKGDDAASAENPFIVQFTVTGSMKQQLGNKNLLIRGVNYTVTDVYVLEGTPVVESGVKGYLTVSAAGMATFMLPFNVTSLPTGVQAYNLTNNGDATIWAEEVTSLTADQPVLIIASAGEYEFVSDEAGASDDITSKTGTFTNGALVGTYTTIDQLAEQTDGRYNYILSNGDDGVAFYQVLDNSCSVAPYRAYLSCAHNANAGGPNHAPRMRIVFHKDVTTGVENTESAKMGRSTKFLRDGQLIILRNGVEYNANGALIK